MKTRRSSINLQRVLTAIFKDNDAPSKKRDATRELEQEKKRQEWKLQKRDLSGRANGTIDPWYGCFLAAELEDYALNFSMPWSK